MTDLTKLLRRIDWSGPVAARRLGVSYQTMRWWLVGRNSRGNPCEAPEWALAYLRRVMVAIEVIPPPRKP